VRLQRAEFVVGLPVFVIRNVPVSVDHVCLVPRVLARPVSVDLDRIGTEFFMPKATNIVHQFEELFIEEFKVFHTEASILLA
jgi:hypothetical protein